MSSCVQDCNCLEGVKADGRSWTDGIVVWRTEGHGNQDNCRALGLYVMVEGAIRAKLDPRPTGTRLELGTTIGSNGDNEIIPCARSRSEIAGADVKRTCATWEIKVCGTKQPIGTSSLDGSDADLWLVWRGFRSFKMQDQETKTVPCDPSDCAIGGENVGSIYACDGQKHIPYIA